MLKTFRALLEGLGDFGFPKGKVREVARTFPSAYELLPTDPSVLLFRSNGAAASPMQVTNWCQDPAMTDLLTAASSSVSSLLLNQIPVETCMIYGTGIPTTTLAKENGGKVTFDKDTNLGDGTVPLISARGDGLTSTGQLLRFAIPFGVHSRLFGIEKVQQKILTPVLLGRPLADTQLFSGFQAEPIFVPGNRNLFAAHLFRKDGTPIVGAKVRLTIEGTDLRDRIVPERNPGEYELAVTINRTGVRLRYVVTADVNGLADPAPDEGFLMSTRS
jgi:hypothetical protein